MSKVAGDVVVEEDQAGCFDAERGQVSKLPVNLRQILQIHRDSEDLGKYETHPDVGDVKELLRVFIELRIDRRVDEHEDRVLDEARSHDKVEVVLLEPIEQRSKQYLQAG